ncbi:C6 zinc finger domain protein [Colletotrichum higginsianum IMI 349063]|uniref:C6 zinc finger domain protein n=1 Tax=Colletotrichum higginsianum (strain IMI 349063) TaxID=759273 RepID=A0A1B7YDC8_COLHI|nr:C6 zinc finger domain protein [Colletotrichum higginsianum IMI 349063]OBR10049.1 C6 zinc finger domain protein [Colletotrichum higginsianum IMI 349063]
MADNLDPPIRNIQRRTKVKTGCATCRIRRVKCDENKPFCRKCVSTGRTCDGYASPFRLVFARQSINSNVHAGSCIEPGAAGLQLFRPTSTGIEISPQDIDLLGRYFSTKTMFDVKLGCNEEARQILQASQTDPTIQHAVSSLRALREQLEASVAQRTPSYGYDYGLQQYCIALGGLATRLSSPSPKESKSALLCCQIFISIEQVRGNYAAMTQHIIQGLSIMREYRARPKSLPADREKIPLLDVFIIKLFAAPCKFADSPATTEPDASGTVVAICMKQSAKSRNLRAIAPDIRTRLTRIAGTTLEFLDRLSRLEPAASAPRLLSEQASLLNLLDSWLVDLKLVLADMRPSRPEPLSVSFLRFFHQILKVALLGALCSSPDLHTELRTEIDRLRPIAGTIEEGVKAYETRGGMRKWARDT